MFGVTVSPDTLRADLLLQPDALPTGPVRAGTEEPFGQDTRRVSLGSRQVSLVPSHWFLSQKAETTVGPRQAAGQGQCWSLEEVGGAGQASKGSLHVETGSPRFSCPLLGLTEPVSMGTVRKLGSVQLINDRCGDAEKQAW